MALGRAPRGSCSRRGGGSSPTASGSSSILIGKEGEEREERFREGMGGGMLSDSSDSWLLGGAFSGNTNMKKRKDAGKEVGRGESGKSAKTAGQS